MTLAFKNQFVDLVIAGTKPHTIRKDKCDRWRVGRAIQFYQDNRLPTMRKFRDDDVAKVVQKVVIYDGQKTIRAGAVVSGKPGTPTVQHGTTRGRQPQLHVDGRQLTPLECQELARHDGFEDFAQLLTFFREVHGLPFTGKLIGWTDLRY